MVQWLTVLAAKNDNLYSMPGTHGAADGPAPKSCPQTFVLIPVHTQCKQVIRKKANYTKMKMDCFY